MVFDYHNLVAISDGYADYVKVAFRFICRPRILQLTRWTSLTASDRNDAASEWSF